MLIVILLVAFVLVPLIDLVLKENAQFFVKVIVYVMALLYVLYGVFILKATV